MGGSTATPRDVGDIVGVYRMSLVCDLEMYILYS